MGYPPVCEYLVGEVLMVGWVGFVWLSIWMGIVPFGREESLVSGFSGGVGGGGGGGGGDCELGGFALGGLEGLGGGGGDGGGA